MKTKLKPEQVIDRRSDHGLYFLELLRYVYGLQYGDTPDYGFYKEQLNEII
eukprot:CAMPEP_0202978942 /NCGR_PEP_ID=MMETSP1396-20130829/85220_1 /ASSEMBLY_ACC=CAM_ASM_000872 /TAXON_ID= /ORGANISM="Pseudokeronopsis sp., Strain Brazil" /LENGTH=50 /DNA_ID=CAMNT_0049718129 /DNA_START=785 /DNA_END=937 /DNA_ORIENTATION=+